ncbi:MAG: polysaccharide biosynthesis protein GumE, partial [Verrucomicrobiaceae bacterium]|nr:polysaccharide biosynthesis protein GumE [Verrucomicrobiaceae bacterium]
LLISDSRYAFACAIVLIAGNAVLRRIPQQLGFVLFFGVILAAGAIVLISGVSAGRDDFLGRLYYTFNSMNRLDLPMLLGFKFDFAVKFMDSGLLYFVVSQSLPVVVLLTVLYSVGIVATGPEAKLYKTCTLIAVALSLLISNSLFSIKVAALMWYCLGAFASASSRNKTAQSAPVNAEINLAGLQHSK